MTADGATNVVMLALALLVGIFLLIALVFPERF